MRILLTILEFIIILDLATTIIGYMLRNKAENIDEEVAKIDFNIEGLEIAAKIIEILKNPTSELTEEQKDQCREFCNNIYSNNKYSGENTIPWKETRCVCTKRFGNTTYETPQCIGMCCIINN